MAGLCLSGVSTSFRGKQVLDAVDATISATGVTPLIGSNGAGKSTLLRCVLALQRHSGDIAWNGARVRPDDSPFTVLFHDAPLYPQLTGKQNLALFLRGDRPAGADALIDRAVLSEKVRTYSRGQRQRLALAVALSRPHAWLTEIRYHWYNRTFLLLAALAVAGSVAAFSGSSTGAKADQHRFPAEVADYHRQGVQLSDVLSRPVTVTTAADGSQQIDNPLKYDFLEVGKSISALHGFSATAGTLLDLLTFIVIPLAFIYFGAYSATFDRRAGALKLRVAAVDWPTIVLAKLGSTVAAAAFLLAVVLVTAAALAALGGVVLGGSRVNGFIYPVVAPTSASPQALQFAVSLGIATVFGAVGYAIGALTGSTSWPVVGAALILFPVPIQGAADPRNAMAVLGEHVFNFWGQFKLRPPAAMSLGAAGLVLVMLLAASVAVALLLPRPRARYR